MHDWKAIQNRDGGWSYSRGASWTEPTAMVLLAQIATGADRRSFDSGVAFLRRMQRADGGWSPMPSVAESTWTTAAVALLPESTIGTARLDQALEWLVARTGMESTWQWKLRKRLAGNRDELPDGWPWFPGAAAWVIPTAFGVLAFRLALARKPAQKIWTERLQSGRNFLLTHMCADGGWNHGGNRALGRDGDSYPETTGIALMALAGVADSPQLRRAKAAARRHLANCRTAEGTSWLRMGLKAHGEIFGPGEAAKPVCRTVLDTALVTIANGASNPLLG